MSQRPSVDVPDADGPPPPPFVRERQRRRRQRRWFVLGVVLVLLVVAALGATVVGIVLGDDDVTADGTEGLEEEAPREGDADDDPGGTDEEPGGGRDEGDDRSGDDPTDSPDREGAGGDGGEADLALDGPIDLDDAGRPDREVEAEDQIATPDLSRLDLAETRIADLLLDIDASERAMLGFNLDARSAFGQAPEMDRDQLFDELRAAAGRANAALAVLRDRLESSQDDPRAEAVRVTYVEHLESWVRYLDAVEEDPSVIGDRTRPYTVDINRTGDRFKRAVDELTAASRLDRELRRFADAVVERGFPDAEESQA